jgi:hypothetical protein
MILLLTCYQRNLSNDAFPALRGLLPRFHRHGSWKLELQSGGRNANRPKLDVVGLLLVFNFRREASSCVDIDLGGREPMQKAFRENRSPASVTRSAEMEIKSGTFPNRSSSDFHRGSGAQNEPHLLIVSSLESLKLRSSVFKLRQRVIQIKDGHPRKTATRRLGSCSPMVRRRVRWNPAAVSARTTMPHPTRAIVPTAVLPTVPQVAKAN